MKYLIFPKERKLFFFWKGRVALYTILKALNIGAGDEVIIPGFTCVVVPNAILYTGAKPVYADIDEQTYNINPNAIEPLITSQTKAVIVQNTFGLSSDIEPIMTLAQKKGIAVIEDCAHGLGGFYRGIPNGSLTDASFFSTQWSKPVSTGLGGIACVRNSIGTEIDKIYKKMPSPSITQQIMLYAQYLIRPLSDNPLLYYSAVSLYRFLTQKCGLKVGSSSGEELESSKMPSNYMMRMGNIQYRQLQSALNKIEIKVKERQKTADYYDRFLCSVNMEPPFRPCYAVHTMLRYSIRVQNKANLLEKAKKMQIPLGDWFVSPLHPVTGDLMKWGYEKGMCPVAEQACNEVVNLFTDQPLSLKQLSQLFC